MAYIYIYVYVFTPPGLKSRHHTIYHIRSVSASVVDGLHQVPGVLRDPGVRCLPGRSSNPRPPPVRWPPRFRRETGGRPPAGGGRGAL